MSKKVKKSEKVEAAAVVADEVVEAIAGQGEDAVEAAAPAVAEKKDRMFDIVEIEIPVFVKVKKKIYRPGAHKVERHLAETIREMVDKKQRSDLAIFVGKNFQVERLLDRSLVVKEVKQ